MSRRVAITGLGVVAPGGVGVKPFWEQITSGQAATSRISFFDPGEHRCHVAAECDFEPAEEGLSPQEIRRMDRVAQFAVTSAREAVADSGLDIDGVTAERTGVAMGNAVGCTMSLESEYVVLSDKGSDWLARPTRPTPH